MAEVGHVRSCIRHRFQQHLNTCMMQPTFDELRQAFQAGFQSIDEGDTFYAGFNEYLASLGYQLREDRACTCPDEGAHGHMPECRWVKA